MAFDMFQVDFSFRFFGTEILSKFFAEWHPGLFLPQFNLGNIKFMIYR